MSAWRPLSLAQTARSAARVLKVTVLIAASLVLARIGCALDRGRR